MPRPNGSVLKPLSHWCSEEPTTQQHVTKSAASLTLEQALCLGQNCFKGMKQLEPPIFQFQNDSTSSPFDETCLTCLSFRCPRSFHGTPCCWKPRQLWKVLCAAKSSSTSSATHRLSLPEMGPTGMGPTGIGRYHLWSEIGPET